MKAAACRVLEARGRTRGKDGESGGAGGTQQRPPEGKGTGGRLSRAGETPEHPAKDGLRVQMGSGDKKGRVGTSGPASRGFLLICSLLSPRSTEALRLLVQPWAWRSRFFHSDLAPAHPSQQLDTPLSRQAMMFSMLLPLPIPLPGAPFSPCSWSPWNLSAPLRSLWPLATEAGVFSPTELLIRRRCAVLPAPQCG